MVGVKRLYVRNKPDRYIFKLKKTNKTQINKKKTFFFWYRVDSIIRNEIERVDWIHVYTVKWEQKTINNILDFGVVVFSRFVKMLWLEKEVKKINFHEEILENY